MDRTTCSKPEGFMCQCMNVYVPRDQLQEHLELPRRHILSKAITPKSSLDEELKESLSKKIDTILKIQREVQQVSARIIQTINQNTLITIHKLEQLVRIYREILFNPPEAIDPNLKETEIVNTFKLQDLLVNALNQHFGQRTVAKNWTIERLSSNAKSKIKNVFKKYSAPFFCMVASSDESFIVTGGQEGAIRVWNLKTKAQILYLKKHRDTVRSVALGSMNKVLLSGSDDSSVRLWNLENQKQEHKFKGHSDVVISVSISKDEKTGFSGSIDGSVKVLNLQKKVIEFSLTISYPISTICLIQEEKTLVTAGKIGSLSFVDLKTKKLREIQNNKNNAISEVCFTESEKHFITGYANGEIEIWNTATLRITFKAKELSNQIIKILILDNSDLFAVCSIDGKVVIWNLENTSKVNTFIANGNILKACFLKNSGLIAFCTNIPSIETCRIDSKFTEPKIKGKGLGISAISISTGLRYMAYGTFSLILYDLEKSKKIRKFPHYKYQCSYLKFTPDSAYLGCGYASGEIYILKVPCLTLFYSYSPSKIPIRCLAFSRKKNLIGFGTDEEIKIQSLEKNEVVFKDLAKVADPEFFLNDEKFVFISNNSSICILNKNFAKEKVFNFNNFIRRLIAIQNSDYIIIRLTGDQFWMVNLVVLEQAILFKNSKELKNWAKDKKKFNYQAIKHLGLFNI